MAIALPLPGSRLWRNYNISLRASPIATKAVTCAAAYAIGDFTAQVSALRSPSLRGRLENVDLARTVRMALYGLMWCGPAGHAFYQWLEKALMPGNPTALAALVGKVGVDQLVFLPASTFVFFAWANIASGTPERLAGDLATKLMPSIRAAWALWVPVMAINMAVVPPAMRILWINAMCIVWTNILSGMASSGAVAPEVVLPEAVNLGALAEQLLAPAAPEAGTASVPKWGASRNGVAYSPRSSKDKIASKPRDNGSGAPSPHVMDDAPVADHRRSFSFTSIFLTPTLDAILGSRRSSEDGSAVAGGRASMADTMRGAFEDDLASRMSFAIGEDGCDAADAVEAPSALPSQLLDDEHEVHTMECSALYK